VGTPSEQLFDDFARLAAIACDTPVAVVTFIDEQRVWFKAKIGLEVDEIPRQGSFCFHAILQGDVLTVLDSISDEKFTSKFQVADLGVRFYAGIPLTIDHHAVGALAVMDRVPHLMTSEQSESLRILARRLVHELERRRSKETQAPTPRLHLLQPPARSITVLIVEDNDNLRNLLQRTLEGVGFSVLSANDGAVALDMCQQHDGTIDLLVSDVVMPRLNGLQLSEQLRLSRPEIKLLFITGFADEVPALRELIKSGATILEKPFLSSELLRKVEDMLNPGQAASDVTDLICLTSEQGFQNRSAL
jgi:CheY-like chemotaxis protein